MADLELRVLFRDSAWRWRLGTSDEVELWLGPKLLGSIPGAMVMDIFRDYLNKLALFAHFQTKLNEPRPEVIGPDPVERARLRSGRRTRKPLNKALALLFAVLLGLGAGVVAHRLTVDPTTERAEADAARP